MKEFFCFPCQTTFDNAGKHHEIHDMNLRQLIYTKDLLTLVNQRQRIIWDKIL